MDSSEPTSDILRRIEREAGIPGLATLLAERLKPTDLNSLLLEVYRQRARRLRPAQVLAAYEQDRFVRPASVSPARLQEWDRLALATLPSEFQPIALSPVCLLGTCSAVAAIDQNWTVATARNTEVVSDATNVLALEASVRRREILRHAPRSVEPIHLAASHRLLRPQLYPDPRAAAHFALFALCSAGRDTAETRFGPAALATHIRFHLTLLRAFIGSTVPLQLLVTDFGPQDRTAQIEETLLASIRAEFDNTECRLAPERTTGRGYYLGLCFHINAATPSGTWANLADGGEVDWTQRLLHNARERLVISGIGSERICTLFGE